MRIDGSSLLAAGVLAAVLLSGALPAGSPDEGSSSTEPAPTAYRSLAHPVRMVNGPNSSQIPRQIRIPELLRAYRIDALHERGLTGQGTTVIIPAMERADPKDLREFVSRNQLPPLDISWQGDDPGSTWAGSAESTMDISIVHAVAPSAEIKVITFPGEDPSIVELIDKWSTAFPGAIWSWSLGLCETAVSRELAYEMAAAIKRSSDSGAVHFASSGDSAGYDCFQQSERQDPPQESFIGVILPASAPETIAVGGTRLWLKKSGDVLRETPWFDSSTMLGSGGGHSQVFPSRTVPDVSGNGDPETGMLFVFQGDDYAAGGTSASAPLWAGIGAILQQSLAETDSGPLGPFQETLARVGRKHGKAVFRDPALGHIATARPADGYDPVTGWGAPDVVELEKSVREESRR